MEGQIEEITTAEEVLASSSEIQGDDLEGFKRGAEGFLKAFMPSGNLILSDLNDAELVDTSAPQPLGIRKIISAAVLESHHRVIETGKPQISTLFEAQMTHSLAISVSVPVLRDGKVVYVLDMPITSQHLSHVLEQQHFDPHWIVAMWDRNGTVIARNKDWERYVGKEAAPSIRPFLSEEHDRVIATKTFEGEEVSTAISHSVLLGITLALGIPRESLLEPRQQALYFIIGVSALCLLISGIAAIRLAHSLIAAERTRDLLIGELNHRIGNMLSTVQGIAHQTLHSTKTKEEAAQSIEDRIMALARAHRLLTDENWKPAPLQTIVNSALEPFRQRTGRFAISGSDKVHINPKVALAITLAMNELATNATKYGALSVPAGHVKIDWVMEGNQRAIITWTESEGPPVTSPTRQGFGSILFSRGLASELGSDVTVHYRPGGVVCIMHCPVEDAA